ncbi:VanZ family protein [Aliikangiella sp. IMCC44632]
MGWLLWMVVFVIVYGSVYPFDFVWVDPASIAWFDWTTQLQQRTTNGDILSNYLTFIPLGFCSFLVNPLKVKSIALRIASVILLSLLLAYLMQLIQFYIPSRVPTVADVLVNFWGICTGVMCGVLVAYQSIKSPQIFAARPPYFYALFSLIVCWFLYKLFPLMPSFSWQSLSLSLQPLVMLSQIDGLELIFQSLLWWALWNMLSKFRLSLTLSRMIVLVCITWVAEVLVKYNSLTLEELIAPLIGSLFFIYVPKQKEAMYLSLCLIAIYLFKGLLPFNYKVDLSSVNWVPFKSYLKGSMWMNTHLFLQKIYLLGSILYFNFVWLGRFWYAFLASFLVVITAEMMKLFLGGASPDISEFIIVSMIAVLFLKMEQLPRFMQNDLLRLKVKKS